MALTAILLYVLIFVVTLSVYYIRQRMNYWKKRGIPHDEPSLLRGNLQGLLKEYHLKDVIQNTYKKFKGVGPYCGFYFFQKPAAFITDINLMKNILIKDFSYFGERNSFYNEKDDPLSAHLFSLNYTKWKPLRNKLTPTFTSGKMKFMFPTVLKVGEEFAETFGEMLDESSTVEVKELFARYTTDVIGTCAFGIDCKSLKDPNAEFRVMGRIAFEKLKEAAWRNGFGMAFPNLARKLGITIFDADVTNFFMKAVRDTIAFREAHNIKRNDFMDMLIEMKNSTENGKGKADMRLTIEELAAQAFVFYLAGFETSSTASGFILYELALNQDVQDKLREEINAVYAKNNGELTYDGMKEMQYMDQVIAETLRLYTILPTLERRCTADYQVPGEPKYKIEKGTMVIIPAAAVHRDPEFYPNPDVFNPEHFAPERVQGRESVLWLPFGDGPRNCIGMRFGQMQMRIGLAMLLQKFKFSVGKQTEVPIKIDNENSLCASKGGIFLHVEKV